MSTQKIQNFKILRLNNPFPRNIAADVSLGLLPEQSKMIGNHHNRKTTTKKVLFQEPIHKVDKSCYKQRVAVHFLTDKQAYNTVLFSKYLLGRLLVIYGILLGPSTSST